MLFRSYLGGLMLDKLEKLTGAVQKEEDPWDDEAPVTKPQATGGQQ